MGSYLITSEAERELSLHLQGLTAKHTDRAVAVVEVVDTVIARRGQRGTLKTQLNFADMTFSLVHWLITVYIT